MSARQPPNTTIACSLMTPLAVFVLGAGLQVGAPDPDVPTSIEQALIERACNATNLPPSAEVEARQQCFRAELLSLRGDFGRDLSRLSTSDRKRIDAACAGLRPAERREAYLDCLSAQLVALRRVLNHEEPAALAEAAAPPSPLAAPLSPPAHQASRWPSATVIGGTVGSAIAAAGVALFAARSRRTRRICRSCGASVPDSDLCTTCRHEAAEALRRAAVERAHLQLAQQEEESRQRECEAQQREQKARDDEEARIRAQELVNRREEAERQRQAEEAQREAQDAVVPAPPPMKDVAFDPYVVLGVPREASPEDVRAAYQQAKTTADADSDFVSSLGDDVQGRFRAKAKAIERAYRMLVDVRP